LSGCIPFVAFVLEFKYPSNTKCETLRTAFNSKSYFAPPHLFILLCLTIIFSILAAHTFHFSID